MLQLSIEVLEMNFHKKIDIQLNLKFVLYPHYDCEDTMSG